VLNRSVFPVALIFFALSGVSSRLVAASAGSDEGDRKVAARALFQEGLREADARRWSRAADRFERARALRASPEITYNLTTALMRLGKFVRASELLREITSDPQASPAVKEATRVRQAEVLPKLASLRIAPAPLQGQRTAVYLDGNRVDADKLGAAIAVDPTFHSIQQREGMTVVAWREVSLREGELRTVNLAVAPEGEDFAGAGGLASGQLGANARETVLPAASGKNHTWMWVVGGVVVAGVATAIVIANRDPSAPMGNAGTWTLGGQ
jgi:hypothetical protein